MEGRGQPQQEDNIPARISTYSSILPSMPQESDSQDGGVQPQASQSRAVPHSHYATTQSPGLKQHYAQPRATHPSTEPGGFSEESILPSNIYGSSPYSPTTPGSGTYSPLLPMSAMPPSGISPVPPYPGFASYQSPMYGFGSSGQGFSYDSNSSIPHPPLGVGVPGSLGTESAFGAHSYLYYGSGYPHPYPGHIGHGYDGAPRRGRGHYQGGPYQPVNKSYAKNPGKPIFKNENRLGPEGANLFVFHIPNEMTNYDLFQLFQSYGNVLSVRIMTEESTGRGRGYGFVSYDSAESAATAIHHLNGLPIQGKRLKVQYKQVRHDAQDRQRYPSYADSILPIQDYSTRPYEPREREDFIDEPHISGFVPIREPEATETKSPVIESNSASTDFISSQDNSRSVKIRGFGTILPSIEDLNKDIDFSGDQGDQRNTPSPSPLANMKDIRSALPDP